MNPFYIETIRLGRKNIRIHAQDVDERLRCVERFDARQCRAALLHRCEVEIANRRALAERNAEIERLGLSDWSLRRLGLRS